MAVPAGCLDLRAVHRAWRLRNHRPPPGGEQLAVRYLVELALVDGNPSVLPWPAGARRGRVFGRTTGWRWRSWRLYVWRRRRWCNQLDECAAVDGHTGAWWRRQAAWASGSWAILVAAGTGRAGIISRLCLRAWPWGGGGQQQTLPGWGGGQQLTQPQQNYVNQMGGYLPPALQGGGAGRWWQFESGAAKLLVPVWATAPGAGWWRRSEREFLSRWEN